MDAAKLCLESSVVFADGGKVQEVGCLFVCWVVGRWDVACFITAVVETLSEGVPSKAHPTRVAPSYLLVDAAVSKHRFIVFPGEELELL